VADDNRIHRPDGPREVVDLVEVRGDRAFDVPGDRATDGV
jgi:hypothetical protein